MPWGKNEVNFIILVGVTGEKQKYQSFGVILDVLIENFPRQIKLQNY